MPEVAVVIPCYNEERRLQREPLLRLAADPRVRLLFVDDGSRDRTVEVLRSIQGAAAGRIEVIELGRNRGKAEAVRAGLLRALEGPARAVGYLDADLSTPPEEFLRLVAVLDEGRASVVMGARIRLLGTRIRRSPMRHYLGRVFATCASIALDMGVYDTQCGAKVFRATPALHAALAAPFRSRWVFDVELIARLRAPSGTVPAVGVEEFAEVPLGAWEDVAGSKLGALQMLGSALDLVRIAWSLRGA